MAWSTWSKLRPVNDLDSHTSGRYSDEEWLLRCKLASYYRLVEYYGWTYSVYNHISVRISSDRNEFLLNPFGLLYSEMTAGSLVKVDIDGNILDPGITSFGINKAGYILHSAIHSGREDILCLAHSHEPSCAAVSFTRDGLLPISQESLIVGKVSYHDYQGILVDEAEKASLIEDFQFPNKVMFLRNHGILCAGQSIEESFFYLMNSVRACEYQVKCMAMNPNSIILLRDQEIDQVQSVVRESYRKVNMGQVGASLWSPGSMDFEAHMRLLDNLGCSTGYPYKMKAHLPPFIR